MTVIIPWRPLAWWNGLVLSDDEILELYRQIENPAVFGAANAVVADLQQRLEPLAAIDGLSVHDLLERARGYIALGHTEATFLGERGRSASAELRTHLLRFYLLLLRNGRVRYPERWAIEDFGRRRAWIQAGEDSNQALREAIAASIAGPPAIAEINRLVKRHGGTQFVLLKILVALDAEGIAGPGRYSDQEMVAEQLRRKVAALVRKTGVARHEPHAESVLGDIGLVLHDLGLGDASGAPGELFLDLFERALQGEFDILFQRTAEETIRDLEREGDFRRREAVCSECGAPWKKTAGYRCPCSTDAKREMRPRDVTRVDAERVGQFNGKVFEEPATSDDEDVPPER